jgi:diguanylate cyclase (GGDEF)-like protein/PAS domain S-box-containing protein
MTRKDDDVEYKALLESTRAIPWKIDWSSQRFAYIGPQIEQVLGWSQSSWTTVQDWADRIHDEDRQRVVDFCVAQSIAGVDHEADYRALTRDGRYVWIRDVVHVVRRPDGTVDSLIGFMFDISERKQTEEQLLILQRELEDLSFKDGLTGIGNRRRFDTIVRDEWEAARKTHRPISLILVDIDSFKEYNDCYGHIQGDDCLRKVAVALRAGATRQRDFLARYGGEEFVILLPDTAAEGALAVAARCRQAVCEANIPHARSAVSPVVTISIGVGTIIPSSRDEPTEFIHAVDQRLYRAKEAGRDTICTD